jgi:predicted nucleic acid-binding protein
MPNGRTSCFVDTNVIVYTVDPGAPEKRSIATSLLRRTIKNRTLVLSLQSLNEWYHVVTDKRRLMGRDAARNFVSDLNPLCKAPLNSMVMQRAWQIQDAAGYSIWDCLLLASASLAGCGLFLSEDLQHDRQIMNVKILNPFALAHLNDLPI